MHLTGVELYSSNLSRSREFYRDILGLATSEEVMSHHIMFDEGDAFLCLEVFSAENYPPQDKAVLFFEVSDLTATADRIGREHFVKLDLETSKPWAVRLDRLGRNAVGSIFFPWACHPTRQVARGPRFAHSSRGKKVSPPPSSAALQPASGCVVDRPRPVDRHRGRGGRGLENSKEK